MLVYILGAIFLMGLLVMLVKGSSNPGGGIDGETAVIRVSDAQRYAGEVERAITMIMRNGHGESDLRFFVPNTTSATSDTEKTRQIFDTLGGGAEFRDPPQGVNDGTPWTFSSRTHIPSVGTNDDTKRKAELLMVLPNVNETFCARVNEANGQTTLNLALNHDPSGEGCIYTPDETYDGTFLSGTAANALDKDTIPHNPAVQACIRCQGGNLHFYHVLLAR